MATAKKIYELTMALIDEMLDSGAVDYASTKDYTARTPGILSILQTEVVTYLNRKGADLDYPDVLTSMTDEVDLDDNICNGVLPYALAARLLMEEDSTLANYFSSLYNNNLEALTTAYSSKAEWVDRDDYYGLLRAGD